MSQAINSLVEYVDGKERAVSPVIGVILMVAITVILAAVIGAFVLEIGDQQETAPNTSFDSEQNDVFINNGGNKANLTQVELTHAGGDVLSFSQAEVTVNGGGSVAGFQDGKVLTNDPTVAPQPDFTKTLGSNAPVELNSGQTWAATIHRIDENPGGEANILTDRTWEEWINTNGNLQYICLKRGDSSSNPPKVELSGSDKLNKCDYNAWLASGSFGGEANQLTTDDSVRVVWNSESGGKTQTLFRYTVQ